MTADEKIGLKKSYLSRSKRAADTVNLLGQYVLSKKNEWYICGTFEAPRGVRQVNGVPQGGAERCTTAARVAKSIVSVDLQEIV